MNKNTPVGRTLAAVEQRMIKDGTMARIDALAARNNAYAQSLGYDNAQQAFNALGKQFLADAKNYAPTIPAVSKAVAGCLSLLGLGWEVELATRCSHDGVFDLVSLDDFIVLCQSAIKERQAAANN